MTQQNRATFGSKLGVLMATVGCAVGLGNIWRFPYMLGQNGGCRISCCLYSLYHFTRITGYAF